MSDELVNKGGRPLIELDMEGLTKLMQLKPTVSWAAAYFKCSEDTIERRIKEETGMTFREFRDQGLAPVQTSLAKLALQKALEGDNTMLIFCLKNYCQWTDRDDAHGVQVNIQNNLSQNVTVEKVDLEDRIKLIKGENDGED